VCCCEVLLYKKCFPVCMKTRILGHTPVSTHSSHVGFRN
jgi:hypothetical protein